MINELLFITDKTGLTYSVIDAGYRTDAISDFECNAEHLLSEDSPDRVDEG